MTLILETSGERAGIEELWERYGATPESMTFMALADQLRRRGCQGEAVQICSRAKANNPNYVSCRVLLGRCLMELGLRDEALKELEEVLDLDRENAFSLRVMAELRTAQNNLSEAANYYRALVRINPSDLDMQERLAEVVRALEPTNADVHLPVGQEPAVRPIPGPVSCPTPEPAGDEAVQSIEEAVESAMDQLRTPETLVPAWHMEDRAAGALAGPQPLVPADPRLSEAETTATVQTVSAQDRKHPRAEVLSFNYSNRQSDFSIFAQWVERHKGGARK